MLSWTQNLVPFIHVCLRNSVFVEPLSLFLSVQLSSAPSRPSALPQHRPANGYDKPRAAAGDFSYNIYINVFFFFSLHPSKCKRNAVCVCVCAGAGTGSKNSLYPSISVYKSETTGKNQKKTAIHFEFVPSCSVFVFHQVVTALNCSYETGP